jgi:hypothetical protein
VLILGCSASGAFADGIEVTVDRAEASIEDQIVLTVTVEGSRSASPSLPDLSPFEVIPRGQSSQVSFVNGRASSSVIRNYVLVPKSTGSFVVGPATTEIDGTVYSSRPFQVRITEATTRQDESRDLYITTRVSTTTPYVGQQVIYTWRFFRKVQIGDARLEPQDYSGFLVEELGELNEYRTQVGGVLYVVSEYRKALFPQELGEVTIPPSRLTCQVVVEDPTPRRNLFDSVFGRATTKTKVLRSREITLTVRPRPAPPRNFSGLVGSFQVQSSVSRKELKVGESTTLKLRISGTGNAQMIGEPRFPDLKAFKVYGDKPTGELSRSKTGLGGSQTFSKALVPLEPGAITVPPVKLIFFDPESGGYRTVQTMAIELSVLPSDDLEELRLTESVAPNSGKVAVRILADDILPSYKRVDAIRPSQGTASRAMVAAGLLAPPILFLGVFVFDSRRRRHRLDATIKRRRTALTRAKRSMKKMLASTPGASALSIAAEISNCLRTYIGDKIGAEGAALTPAEVVEALESRRVSQDTIDRAARLLEVVDSLQYGASTAPLPDLPTELQSVVRKLERQL